ncbi:MAG TPA: flagellar basal body rod protein FlgC [Longimicrobiales bacterium]
MRIGGSWFVRSLAMPVVRPLFRGLAIAASGLSAQRQRIEVAAHNLANAETTRTDEGGPYRRKVVALAPKVGMPDLTRPVRPGDPWILPPAVIEPVDTLGGVQVLGVEEDPSPGELVYDPGHPDADEAGYVRYPNVRVSEEMVTLMEARRAYEANATVFDAMKSMLRRAAQI